MLLSTNKDPWTTCSANYSLSQGVGESGGESTGAAPGGKSQGTKSADDKGERLVRTIGGVSTLNKSEVR